jgi:CRISPR-associated protein Cmr2
VKGGGAWLSFSITPVQKFIEAARTVRDLRTASRLLSHLTQVAIKKAQHGGGTLLYPSFSPVNPPESIPNQFVVVFEDEGTANAARSQVAEAVGCEWKRIAGEVHDCLNKAWSHFALPNWDADWDKQIEGYFDVRTIVVPRDGASVGEQWKRQAAALNASKLIRKFPGDHGLGRRKCSMMGDLEQMGPAGDLEAARKFWDEARQAEISGLWLREREALCAVSLAKRFAPAVEPRLFERDSDIPDTATIATAAWCAAARANGNVTQAYEEWHAKWCGPNKELAVKTGLTLGRCLVEEPQEIEKALGGENDWLKGMLTARNSLVEAARKQGLGPPPRYFAILALDGDEIGKWLSGEKRNVSESFYGDMSEKLLAYAKTVQDIIEHHYGTLVYSGGDDLLALLPVAKALDAAQKLRSDYPQLAPGSLSPQPTTATGGVTILHYKEDLRWGLRRTREIIQQAKQRGRDRLGIALAKRSGGHEDITVKWSTLPRLVHLQNLFAQGASDRWKGRLADVQSGLSGLDPAEAPKAIRNQVAYFAGRVQEHGFVTRESFEQAVSDLFDTLWEDLAEAHDKANATPLRTARAAARLAEAGSKAFPKVALETFLTAVDIASFLVRGRE